jgi:ribosomal protein S12 methylthiotransferase accessory factor
LQRRSAVSPDEILARVLARKDEFGITRVAVLTGLDRTGIPVVMVCRPNARSSAVFNGKGGDLAAAKASGLMEAVETWHAENIRLPLVFASFADLRGRMRLVDIEGLPKRPGPLFDPHLPILWVEGRNLMDDQAIALPFEIVHIDTRMAGPPMSGALSMSTNGLASGASFAGAVSHALCELIERDASSLWRQSAPGEQDARRLDLATVDDPQSLTVLDYLRNAELEVAAWDITTDVGVSAFQCYIIDRTGETAHVGVGSACHPRRSRALLGAILEAAQVRTTYIIGSREDIEPSDYDPSFLARRNAEARALMRPATRPRSFQSAATSEFDSAEAQVDGLLDRLRSIGLTQAVAVDLTRPEYGVPVVRMVVPGLEGFDHHPAQYQPGPRARAVRERIP